MQRYTWSILGLRWCWGVLMVAGLLVAAGCQGNSRPLVAAAGAVAESGGEAEKSGGEAEKSGGEAAVAREGAQNSYFGTLRSRRSVMIAAEVAGVALEVPLERGDKVRAGQVLLRIDDEQYRLNELQASRAVDAASIRVAQVEKTLQLEKARLDAGFKQAQAAVEAASARLKLVELGARNEEKAALRASVKGAKAAMDNAQIELGRIRDLAAADVATGQQLDTAETAAKVATAAYDKAFQALRQLNNGPREEDKDVARAGLKQAEALLEDARALSLSLEVRAKDLEAAKTALATAEIQLKLAQRALRKTQVTATLDGAQEAIVNVRNIDPGETVAPMVPLFELLHTDRPRLVVQLPSAALPALKPGLVLPVSCRGDGVPQRQGKIVLIATQAEMTNLNFGVELELDNSDGALRMGQVCEVRLEAQQPAGR